jgi:hypothetical protein
LEKPPPDPLHGLRIHSWVLILPGKREVPEGFYIEPFTGIAHPLDSSNYLGIESVWNHQNYWVNMQDCSEGVKVCLDINMNGLEGDLGRGHKQTIDQTKCDSKLFESTALEFLNLKQGACVFQDHHGGQ